MYSCIIPARFASTRLPGKPLCDLGGKTMIQRVYEAAANSSADRVIVATDHENIETEVRGFDGEVLLTSTDHPSGTDRLAEVAELLGCNDDDIMVNVQGDEPLIPPVVIDQVANNLLDHPECGVATLCEPVEGFEDFTNPNVVKVVSDGQGRALYFSRAPIPWPRDSMAASDTSLSGFAPMRHIGIYAYRVRALRAFSSFPVAALERVESLEQLRFLANSVAIHVAPAEAQVPGGVDTEADLQRVLAVLGKQKEVG